MADPIPSPVDNSSTTRKVAVPVVAGALDVVAVAALDAAGVHVLDAAPVQAAVIVLLTALGDILLPDRLLA